MTSTKSSSVGNIMQAGFDVVELRKDVEDFDRIVRLACSIESRLVNRNMKLRAFISIKPRNSRAESRANDLALAN